MGKPGLGNAKSAADEHIVSERGTRGTETSKYPKEKKSIEILLVAASERGRAWCDLSCRGVEESGKAHRRG